MRIVEDPVGDPRWSELLDRHPNASIFHSPGWLSALRQTYGYEPFVVTTSAGPTLENGIVVCRVKGWMSRRLVSLPFSDHCDPLIDRSAALSEMVSFLTGETQAAGWSSVELRPRVDDAQTFEAEAGGWGMSRGGTYRLHTVDLRPETTEIFRRFHHSSTQRAIRRAEREGVTYDAGTSEQLLASFYRLLRMTRRRHGLPPQPLTWFRSLLANLGDSICDPCGQQERRTDSEHPDAVVQEDDLTTNTEARMRRIIGLAACRSCSGG